MLLSKKIKISGMQCDSCESRIAGKVRLLDGVISAQADQHKGLLRVIYNSCSINLTEIEQTCAACGYPFVVQSTHKERLTSTALSLLAFTGIVLLLIQSENIWSRFYLSEINSQTVTGMASLSGSPVVSTVSACVTSFVGYTMKDTTHGQPFLGSHPLRHRHTPCPPRFWTGDSPLVEY